MADDLDNFFKKKANKKKKAATVQVEKLGKKLEKSAKLQEEIDRENEAAAQLEKEQEEFIQSRLQEDTEWIDFSEKEVNIQDLNIKDMDVGEPEETDQNGEEVVGETPQEKVRTWNVPNENEKPVENGTPEPEEPRKPSKYLPPSARFGGTGRQEAKPDLTNEMLFPSLGAADEIEEKQKQHEKREELVMKARRLQDLEERRSRAGPAPELQPSRPSGGPNSYVPPHMRSQGSAPAASPAPRNMDSQGYQTQNQRRMGSSTGNAWGNRPVNVAPVNNRFDGLKDT